MNNIFKKFGENLKKILLMAEKSAIEKKTMLDTEHQLLAITTFKDCLASEVLQSFGITADRVQLISSLLTRRKDLASLEKITQDGKKAVQLSVQIAAEYGHFSIEPEHLLIALISDKSFNSYLIVERIGVNPKSLKDRLEVLLSNLKKKMADAIPMPQDQIESLTGEDAGDLFDMGSPLGGNSLPFSRPQSATQKKETFLDQFASNLTALARKNDLDPVIGRNAEIERLVQILCRRTKNNPILIGEPGVGKTTIVEGFVQRIIKGEVPAILSNCEVFSLDIGSILAGTMYRGQFESRIKKILAEVKKRGNIILFADEIHMLVGAGSTEGSIDAANLLKPMLSRGELKLIGSTTFDEYKKHIEKDSAFERRFQPIKVAEPTVAEAIEILKGIKSKYEYFHHIKYTESAIEAAVIMSKRYINDRFLPDKAIDLIDEAGAATYKIPKESQKIIRLKEKYAKLLKDKNELIQFEKYDQASKLRDQELQLEKEIKKISETKTPVERSEITEENIAKIVSNLTGIPVTSLSISEKKRYLSIEKLMKKYVVGQDEAIKEIAKALKRRRVGISNPNKPIGSFIFLGPTGVGKTELAKVLASEVLGNEKSLVKIDMSEFMERHNVARLVGAPAGYVGFEEGGKLTETVRKNPYSIILLDEIEKAHPEVYNILLQIMDEGHLTDAKGRKIDFRNTIVILTSNLGTDIIRKQSAIGFADGEDKKVEYSRLKESILENVEKSFRPEFINRLDQIIVFYPLDQKSIRKIVDLQISELQKRLSDQNYKLEVTEDAREYIAKNSFSKDFGARPVKKYIADHLEMPISDAILKEKYQAGGTIKIGCDKTGIKLTD